VQLQGLAQRLPLTPRYFIERISPNYQFTICRVVIICVLLVIMVFAKSAKKFIGEDISCNARAKPNPVQILSVLFFVVFAFII